jgi:hypothetical protein
MRRLLRLPRENGMSESSPATNFNMAFLLFQKPVCGGGLRAASTSRPISPAST